MQTTYFPTASDINNSLMPNNPADTATTDAMFNDPWYGLSNPENYGHWHALVTLTGDSEEANKRLAFFIEL